MSTLADAMLAWKAKLTTQMTPEQVLTLRSDVNVFVDDVRFLEDENAKLRGLVRDMFYAVHPLDREKFLTNVAELGVDDG